MTEEGSTMIQPKTLPNGIIMYVEYVWEKGKGFTISARSQVLIDKAMTMNYMNRESVSKELEKLAKDVGLLE